MARQEFKVQTNNFTGGLITEASPLSFPENSCLDIENMDINIDGSVSRRQGLRPQAASNPVSTISYTTYTSQAPTYVWRQVAGIPGINLVCVQDGNAVMFYNEQENLGTGLLANFINLVTYRTEAIVPQPPVSMTSVRGVLVITGINIKPIAVEYLDTSPPTFDVTEITIETRDLDGLDDGLEVDERPGILSDEHYYNLVNQGWDLGKINEFFDSQTRYPSNADIWSAGRDNLNEFDPEELVKVDFGTSPAPKGRFVQDVFDNTGTYVAYTGTFTAISLLTVESQTVLEITSTGHGLSSGNDVNVRGIVLTKQGPRFTQSETIEGVFPIISTTVDTFRITIPSIASGFTTKKNGEYSSEQTFIVESGYTTLKRPAVVASFAGRAFYTGIPFEKLSNKVFFSQILTDTNKRLGKAMQEADPTSEIDSEIIATDGGVITINDLGTVVAMEEQEQSLVIFSSNGVWEIRGEGDGFFSAVGYSVRRITSTPVVSGQAVVNVEGTLMFMGEDGIYMLQPNEISGLLNAMNMTAGNINSYYLNKVMPCRAFTSGVYDYKNKKVWWLHGIPPDQWPEVLPNGEDPAKGRLMHKALVFNLETQSFTKYTFPFSYPEVLTPDNTTSRIIGATAIRGISENSPVLRFFTRYLGGDPVFSRVGWLTQDKPKSEGFADSNFTSGDSPSEIPALVVTGHATLGDVGVKKVPRQLILHMLRTETGFTVNGETFTPVHPSGTKVRVAWDFTSDEASNKWQAEFQGYRYRQFAMPINTAPTHVGYDVVTSKTKLRGNGRAFSMRFNSEPGKDMNILGWSITGSVEGSE